MSKDRGRSFNIDNQTGSRNRSASPSPVRQERGSPNYSNNSRDSSRSRSSDRQRRLDEIQQRIDQIQRTVPNNHEFTSPRNFYENPNFSLPLKNNYVNAIRLEEPDSNLGNYGGAELVYPDTMTGEDRSLRSAPYAARSRGNYTDTFAHGERQALYDMLEGEIKYLRNTNNLTYNPDLPHSLINMRRPGSTSPDNSSPTNDNLRRIAGLQRMSTPGYMIPVRDWMNDNAVSINVLTERRPCRTNDDSCRNFLNNYLPNNSNIGSNYNDNDQPENYIANQRNRLIKDWDSFYRDSSVSSSSSSSSSRSKDSSDSEDSIMKSPSIRKQVNITPNANNQFTESGLWKTYAKGGYVEPKYNRGQEYNRLVNYLMRYLDKLDSKSSSSSRVCDNNQNVTQRYPTRPISLSDYLQGSIDRQKLSSSLSVDNLMSSLFR